MNENKIVLFKSADGEVSLPVEFGKDTVWLTQVQMAQLFGKDRTVIGKHIRNAIKEGEVDAATGCANFAYPEENATGIVKVTAYNLDFVISVGYRVHSLRGVEFRRWATKILHEYIGTVKYNEDRGEILYSDSWGEGHELKRMDAADALSITTAMFYLTE